MEHPNHQNNAQQRAIRHDEGPLLVLAGPGSGKTYTIVKRIRYLIETCRIPPAGILVITFTKAAAREMQSRFLTEIRRSYSAVNFGTFHSIYYQILSRSGYIPNFSLVTDAEKFKIIKTVLRPYYPNENLDRTECEAVLHDIGRLKNMEPAVGNNENIKFIYDEYCELLKSVKKMDFDDMIMYCHEMLVRNPQILAGWQQYFTDILVDEFQDINRRQYQILKLLAAPADRLFCVGDDDQSIYGFRGARPAVMSEFLQDFPHCRPVLLDFNYRSTRPIVEAAGKVIAVNRQRLDKNYQARREGGDVIRHSFPDRERENEYLLAELKGRPAELYRETAVILRTNFEVALLAVKCAEQGIPVRASARPRDIFAHFIGTDLMDYLLFAGGERTRARYLNIINKPMRCLSRRSVAAVNGLVEEIDIVNYYHNNSEVLPEVRRFFADCERIARLPPFLAVQFIRKGIGYDRYLKERARPEEYQEWQAIADAVQESARSHRDVPQWQEAIANLSRIMPAPGAVADGIQLMTMHGAKGLEFQTVYLPHLNEGILPNKKALTAEQIEEERRLFYVGMTRAKEKLVLLWTESPKDTPSRFLEPLRKI